MRMCPPSPPQMSLGLPILIGFEWCMALGNASLHTITRSL